MAIAALGQFAEAEFAGHKGQDLERMAWKHISILTVLLVIQTQYDQSEALRIARVDTLQDAIFYLLRFGYLEDINDVIDLIRPPSLSQINLLDPVGTVLNIAISKFQQLARLPVTGKFDETTKRKMNSPRCGNPDVHKANRPEKMEGILRRKRYVTGPTRWTRTTLTYKISRYSQSGLPQEVIDRDVQRAFEVWANVTNLSFHRVGPRTQVDMEIGFATELHGDDNGNPKFGFDGRGIILAHAYAPMDNNPLAGDVHFDDDEDWTSESEYGTNFFHVAVHEIGHALGLRHNEQMLGAVMYPYAKSHDPDFTLHEDDIRGIQSLYGAPGGPIPAFRPAAVNRRPGLPNLLSPFKAPTQLLSGVGGRLFNNGLFG